MLKEFKNNKILLAYYGGSTAYQNKTNKSDTDVIVVLDDIQGAQHITNEEKQIEYYVFGKKYFIEKMEFDEEVTPHLKIFNDDILTNIDPIVLDDSFKETYLKYKNRNFKEYLKPYLEAIIEYYEVFLVDGSLKKNLYHLYRIEEQVQRYLETGEFKIELGGETLEKILVFKENFKTNSPGFVKELLAILNYLKGVKDDVNNWNNPNLYISAWND